MLMMASRNKNCQFDVEPIEGGWCSETLINQVYFYSGLDCNDMLERKTFIKYSESNLTISRSSSAEIPLFYFLSKEDVLYISDSVYELQERVKQEVDIGVAYEYIYSQFLPKEKTLFTDIYQLLNSQEIKFTIKNNKVFMQVNDAFSLPMAEIAEGGERELALQLRQEISLAHQRRMGSRNALFLSGGIDSQVMALTLSRDLELGKSLEGLHFHVKGARQNESEHARTTAKKLGLGFTSAEIDPNKKINLNSLIMSNAPYIGSISIVSLLSSASLPRGTTVYTGQDTRLHTPTLKKIDEKFISLLSKPLIGSLQSRLAKIVISAHNFVGCKYDTKLYRNLSFLAQVNSINHYLVNRFFNVTVLPFQSQKKQGELLELISTDLNDLDYSSMRSLFNSLVMVLWRRQYLYDINYMQSCTAEYGMKLAAPFYDGRLADFSAQLPYNLATRLTSGRAGHGDKNVYVNKYLLRSAYKGELDDSLIYRDKAVCLTAQMFFNGGLVQELNEFMNDDWVGKNEFAKALYLNEIQKMCSYKHKNWCEQDHWLMMMVFNALVVYKALRGLN